MKKIYLMILGLLSLTVAYSQPGFTGASILEQPYTMIPPDSCLRAENVNCYGYSNVFFQDDATQDDLSVFCWLKLRENCLIGWRRNYTGTNSIINEGYLSIPNSIGMDVAILDSNGQKIILAGYYKIGVGHVLDYYKWNVNNLTLISTVTLSNSLVYSPVQIDVNELHSYAVTWEVHGKIYVKVGTIGVAPFISCTRMLQQTGDYHYPDIAIGHPSNINTLSLHLVYTSLNNNQVREAKLYFEDVLSNCTSTIVPQIEDVMNGADFGVPRIDCPDHFDTDDWSYVVSDNHKIQSSIMAHSLSSTPTHYVLNDGSLGNYISIVNMVNINPVLAYDNIGKSIYYCWNSSYPLLNYTVSFIGVKLGIAGNLTNPFYWKMLVNPEYTPAEPSIALSGQNDHSNNLYSVFPTLNPGSIYKIDYKNIPWSNTSFRPETTNISNVETNSNIEISPNPFESGFQLRDLNDEKKELNYNIRIMDIAGRELYNAHGNLIKLNNELSNIGNYLKTGLYILKLKQNLTEKTFKIIKQ